MTVAVERAPSDGLRSSSSIFISYRRQEASYLAAWLYDCFGQRFGTWRIFLDIDSIRPGVDFRTAIDEQLSRAAVLVVLIGREWLSEGPDGRPRLHDPTDVVRIEIETALQRGIPVLPVLMDDVPMPARDALPAALRPLRRFNAARMRRESARRDVDFLITAVADLLGEDADAPFELSGSSTTFDSSWLTGEQRPQNVDLDTGQEQRQRQRLASQLEDVYATYGRHAFGESGAVHLELGLGLLPGATFRPTDHLLPFLGRRTEELSHPASLLQVVDTAGGLTSDGVLLLGEPGAGKTTLLFELAVQLLDRAKSSPEWPLPIFVPLADWAVRGASLRQWLVEQLNQLYQIPPRLGRRWTESGQLIFLLDGLDEIDGLRNRQACAREIDRFTRFGRTVPVPTIVTCRRSDYDALDQKLQLQTAVTIDPLDAQVVVEQLRQTGPRVTKMLSAVAADPELRSMLQSPLLLTILSSTYTRADNETNGVAGVPAPGRHELIHNYVERQLELERARSEGRNRFPPRVTLRWLSVLARHLTDSSQTIFLLDRIQLEWLPAGWRRRLVLLSPMVVWTVVFGISSGFALRLGDVFEIGDTPHPVDPVLLYGSVGLVLGIIMGLVAEKGVWVRSATWLAAGFLMGLLLALVTQRWTWVIVFYGLQFTFLLALLGELATTLLRGRLPLAEHLSFSWTKARAALIPRLLLGVGLGLARTGADLMTVPERPVERLVLAVVSGLVLGLFFGLSHGLDSGLRVSSVPTRVHPREGLRRSTRNGWAVGLAATLVIGLVFFAGGMTAGLPLAVVRAVGWGPGAGALWGLAAGLGSTLQYRVLRVLLWQLHLAPLRYGRWLEYAVSLRLLYRGVGGSYVFLHQTVQAHFARPASDAPLLRRTPAA